MPVEPHRTGSHLVGLVALRRMRCRAAQAGTPAVRRRWTPRRCWTVPVSSSPPWLASSGQRIVVSTTRRSAHDWPGGMSGSCPSPATGNGQQRQCAVTPGSCLSTRGTRWPTASVGALCERSVPTPRACRRRSGSRCPKRSSWSYRNPAQVSPAWIGDVACSRVLSRQRPSPIRRRAPRLSRTSAAYIAQRVTGRSDRPRKDG